MYNINCKYMYNINCPTFIGKLTITIMNPRQQITKVFHTTCISATREKSFSIFLENEITLLCLSISIPNISEEEPLKEIFAEIFLNSWHIISICPLM